MVHICLLISTCCSLESSRSTAFSALIFLHRLRGLDTDHVILFELCFTIILVQEHLGKNSMFNSLECFVSNGEARTRLRELIVVLAQLVTKGVAYHRHAKSLCCPPRPVFHRNMACCSIPSVFARLSKCPCISLVIHHEYLLLLFFEILHLLWFAS
jgi:hypothetical protein